MTGELEAVHEWLKAILKPHATDGLAVTKDGRDGMALEIEGHEGETWGYAGFRATAEAHAAGRR